MFEPGRRYSILAALRRAARESGRRRLSILRDFFRLRRAGRRLLLSEYLAFGLYRRGARPEDFIGVIEGAILSMAINFRKNRRALVHDKLLFDGMMRGLGYPVPEIQAVASGATYGGGFASLRKPGEIAEFLKGPARYPLFLKPARGQNSIRAIALERYDANTDEVVLTDGTRQPLMPFAESLRASFDGALVVQSFIDQHPEVRARIGRTIGSVRVITFLEAGRPQVLRAFWKIPVGNAVADNLWRGNLIATVDEVTGTVGTVRSHTGFDAKEVTHHPDTGAELPGFVLPDWKAATRLCKRSAVLLRGMPLVGWDVAIGKDGALIIEANSVPSVELTQYPEQRGFLVGDLLGRIEAEIARLKTTEVQDAREKRNRVREIVKARILEGLGMSPNGKR